MATSFYKAVLLITLSACFVLTGCSDNSDALQRIKAKGELKVVTRNSPTTYFFDRNGANGIEFVLAQMLAVELGVELKIDTAYTLSGLFETLRRDEADIAAAGLTLTDQRESLYPHSSSYNTFLGQVVYVAGTKRPLKASQLLDRDIVVLANSSHDAALHQLKADSLPDLEWREIPSADSMELLELLATGQAELALIDEHEFEAQRSLYPRLKVAFDLDQGQEQEMVWYFSPAADNTALEAVVDTFFLRLEEDGTLEQLREQFFLHNAGFSRTSSHTFNLNVRTRLPQYENLIRQVAAEYQLDWRLLAAVAYQESHWDPNATSPTGVRGMMMLTKPTAEEIGVENRLDPLQSLRGGSRYFKDLLRRLPKSIEEPDRTWFALAAYNIGMGHLEDARVITQRQGGNPSSWADVSERLPLLQKAAYYNKTRYGYARGVEAATYVKNIRHYLNVLRWQDISDNKPPPPLNVDDYLPDVLRESDLSAL
ncbi:MAG: membrane-bound lytic murein transglycosylase MltF [Pseudomonadota bacterium]